VLDQTVEIPRANRESRGTQARFNFPLPTGKTGGMQCRDVHGNEGQRPSMSARGKRRGFPI
jgi:hypothetical protein